MSTSMRRGFLGFMSTTAAGLLRGRAEAAPVAAETAPACILTPQAEEGPFYSGPKLVRSDIAGGKPGAGSAARRHGRADIRASDQGSAGDAGAWTDACPLSPGSNRCN